MANIKNSKNKSNSQHFQNLITKTRSCGKYQKFKEQKQFTTVTQNTFVSLTLWQISKIQRTKAIHNISSERRFFLLVVANIKNSKNKSNSQLQCKWHVKVNCCGKYQKFKEQKQFTTWRKMIPPQKGCGKYQKFKEQKQFTTTSGTEITINCCGKYQKFKEQKQFTTAM